jgi:hypothetical protein
MGKTACRLMASYMEREDMYRMTFTAPLKNDRSAERWTESSRLAAGYSRSSGAGRRPSFFVLVACRYRKTRHRHLGWKRRAAIFRSWREDKPALRLCSAWWRYRLISCLGLEHNEPCGGKCWRALDLWRIHGAGSLR